MIGGVPVTSEDVSGAVPWAAAWRAYENEPVSGDLLFVKRGDPHGMLVAVIDGLGHGESAAHASSAIAAALDRPDALSASLADLFGHAHDAAKRTRGAAMTLLRFGPDTLEWAGVGNVEASALLRGRSERPFLRPGIVGVRTPAIRASHLPLAEVELVLAATDGVEPEFADRRGSVQSAGPRLLDLASTLLTTHYAARDDALVFVARPTVVR